MRRWREKWIGACMNFGLGCPFCRRIKATFVINSWQAHFRIFIYSRHHCKIRQEEVMGILLHQLLLEACIFRDGKKRKKNKCVVFNIGKRPHHYYSTCNNQYMSYEKDCFKKYHDDLLKVNRVQLPFYVHMHVMVSFNSHVPDFFFSLVCNIIHGKCSFLYSKFHLFSFFIFSYVHHFFFLTFHYICCPQGRNISTFNFFHVNPLFYCGLCL